MSFDLRFVVDSFPAILSAVPMTLFLTVVSVVAGLFLGFFVAMFRLYKVFILNRLAVVYVSLIRGIPVIAMLYTVYYALPLAVSALSEKFHLGISLNQVPPLVYALITLIIYTTAYLSEMIRSAIGSVDAGQMEAAYSVGLTRMQSMRRIVLPQALVVALPNLGNNFLGVLKGTSLASFIGVMELMGRARAEASFGFHFLEAYLVAALLYWGVSFIFERVFLYCEKKVRFGRREVYGLSEASKKRFHFPWANGRALRDAGSDAEDTDG